MKISKSYIIFLLIATCLTLAATASAKKAAIKSTEGLNLENIHFASGDPKNVRKPPVFSPGENVLVIFEIKGYDVANKKASLQADLVFAGPDGKTLLERKNAVDHKGYASEKGKKAFVSLTLSPQAPAGNYTVTITVRDLLGNKQHKASKTFSVK